jgi:hypothetical protein
VFVGVWSPLIDAKHQTKTRRERHRYTFTNGGEQILDQWMDQHAFVIWLEAKAPWEIEKQLLFSGLNLPLNVDGNPSQDAVAVVCAARLKARRLADELDIVSDNGGPRRPQTK